MATVSDHEPDQSSRWIIPFFGGADTGSWLADLGLLCGRLYLGLTICNAGASKFPTVNWFQDQVAGLGFPAPSAMAFLASASEFVGGALLILGLFTRPAAFFNAVTLGVATFAFHKNAIGEMHIAQLYFWMFVLFTCVGGGRLSLDAWLRSRWQPAGNSAGGSQTLLALTALVPLGLVGAALWLESRPAAAAVDPTSKVEQVALAASFNSWNLNKHPMSVDEQGIWRTEFEIEQPGEVEFKFVINRDWRSNLGDTDQTEVGMPASGVAELDNGNNSAANIRAYLPAAGRYAVTIDTKSQAYELTAANTAAQSNASPSSVGDGGGA